MIIVFKYFAIFIYVYDIIVIYSFTWNSYEFIFWRYLGTIRQDPSAPHHATIAPTWEYFSAEHKSINSVTYCQYAEYLQDVTPFDSS